MNTDIVAAVSRYGRLWEHLPAAFDSLLPGLKFSADASKILTFLATPDMPAPDVLPTCPGDQVLLADMNTFQNAIDWRAFRVRPEHRHHVVSEASDDSLVALTTETWSGLFLLNYVLLRSIQPTRRAAVVVAMRDEGVRVLEWVAHYLALGFDGIIIYSNDNNDRSDVLLEALAEVGVVTFVRNLTRAGVFPQVKAVEHALRKLPELRDYEWVFFADADELLMLPGTDGFRLPAKLDELDKRYPFDPPSAICLSWKWYLPGDAVLHKPGLLIERFQHSISHNSFKPIVRLRDALSMVKLHFPLCTPHSFFVDSKLDVLPQSLTPDQEGMWGYIPPQYSGGQVNHYWAKSWEEYSIKKDRGSVADNRLYDQFFDWNVPASAENYDPPPSTMIARVRAGIEALRDMPGVREAEAEMLRGHANMLARFGGQQGLAELHARVLAERESKAAST